METFRWRQKIIIFAEISRKKIQQVLCALSYNHKQQMMTAINQWSRGRRGEGRTGEGRTRENRSLKEVGEEWGGEEGDGRKGEERTEGL